MRHGVRGGAVIDSDVHQGSVMCQVSSAKCQVPGTTCQVPRVRQRLWAFYSTDVREG